MDLKSVVRSVADSGYLVSGLGLTGFGAYKAWNAKSNSERVMYASMAMGGIAIAGLTVLEYLSRPNAPLVKLGPEHFKILSECSTCLDKASSNEAVRTCIDASAEKCASIINSSDLLTSWSKCMELGNRVMTACHAAGKCVYDRSC